MIHFFDTSALLKRYVKESGSEAVRRAMAVGNVVVSRITFAELCATIARAAREGVVSPAVRDKLLSRVDDDFRELSVLEVRQAVLRRVPALVVRHALRAYDAVQLASAIHVAAEGAVTFWCSDVRLVEAGRSEGLRGVVPEG